jgi:hypothetical protein
MLVGLGYDYHPHLPDGRTNVVVQPDNSKPRLYARSGISFAISRTPALIAQKYQEAQGPGGSSDAATAFGKQ